MGGNLVLVCCGIPLEAIHGWQHERPSTKRDSCKDTAEAIGRAVWTSGTGAAKLLNAIYPHCAEIRLSHVEPCHRATP